MANDQPKCQVLEKNKLPMHSAPQNGELLTWQLISAVLITLRMKSLTCAWNIFGWYIHNFHTWLWNWQRTPGRINDYL